LIGGSDEFGDKWESIAVISLEEFGDGGRDDGRGDGGGVEGPGRGGVLGQRNDNVHTRLSHTRLLRGLGELQESGDGMVSEHCLATVGVIGGEVHESLEYIRPNGTVALSPPHQSQ